VTSLLVGIAALALAVGLLAGVKIGLWLQSDDATRLIATLETDRDSARHEAKVLRGLLSPALYRAESSNGKPAVPAQQGVSSGCEPTAPQADTRQRLRRPRRLSTRHWLNQVRQQFNTKQRHVDAVATALKSKIPVPKTQGEKHV
jgi:hypothetical protein